MQKNDWFGGDHESGGPLSNGAEHVTNDLLFSSEKIQRKDSKINKVAQFVTGLFGSSPNRMDRDEDQDKKPRWRKLFRFVFPPLSLENEKKSDLGSMTASVVEKYQENTRSITSIDSIQTIEITEDSVKEVVQKNDSKTDVQVESVEIRDVNDDVNIATKKDEKYEDTNDQETSHETEDRNNEVFSESEGGIDSLDVGYLSEVLADKEVVLAEVDAVFKKVQRITNLLELPQVPNQNEQKYRVPDVSEEYSVSEVDSAKNSIENSEGPSVLRLAVLHEKAKDLKDQVDGILDLIDQPAEEIVLWVNEGQNFKTVDSREVKYATMLLVEQIDQLQKLADQGEQVLLELETLISRDTTQNDFQDYSIHGDEGDANQASTGIHLNNPGKFFKWSSSEKANNSMNLKNVRYVKHGLVVVIVIILVFFVVKTVIFR